MMPLSKKAQDRRLQCYGHAMRRGACDTLRRIVKMEVPREKGSGKPKCRRMNVVKEDLGERAALGADDIFDGSRWANSDVGKDAEKKRKRRNFHLYQSCNLCACVSFCGQKL